MALDVIKTYIVDVEKIYYANLMNFNRLIQQSTNLKLKASAKIAYQFAKDSVLLRQL